MWEKRSTWFCTVCDNQLRAKDAPCDACATFKRLKALEAAVKGLLPWARLYSGAFDSPDFDKDEAKRQRAIAAAERLLRPRKRPS